MIKSNIIPRRTSRRPTLSAIASRIGCSKAVVSTVLNNAKGNTIVSDALRKRVEDTAREIGYVPNFASRCLARKSTRMLGVYIPPGIWTGVGMMYEGRIIRGIERTCQERNYELLLINASGSRNADNCVRKIEEQQVDGILLVHARSNTLGLQQILEATNKIVAVDYNEPEPSSLNAVSFDNTAAVNMAVEHLVELGHKRIMYVGPSTMEPSPDDLSRRNAFNSAIRHFNLPLIEKPSAGKTSIYGGAIQSAVDFSISLGNGMPTAFVTYNDLLAVDLMHRLTDKGIDVPGKVSVIGIDDSPFCTIARPQLTSVRHPLELMGQQAVLMLLELMEKESMDIADGDRTGKRTLFSPELVVRGTTGKAIS